MTHLHSAIFYPVVQKSNLEMYFSAANGHNENFLSTWALRTNNLTHSDKSPIFDMGCKKDAITTTIPSHQRHKIRTLHQSTFFRASVAKYESPWYSITSTACILPATMPLHTIYAKEEVLAYIRENFSAEWQYLISWEHHKKWQDEKKIKNSTTDPLTWNEYDYHNCLPVGRIEDYDVWAIMCKDHDIEYRKSNDFRCHVPRQQFQNIHWFWPFDQLPQVDDIAFQSMVKSLVAMRFFVLRAAESRIQIDAKGKFLTVFRELGDGSITLENAGKACRFIAQEKSRAGGNASGGPSGMTGDQPKKRARDEELAAEGPAAGKKKQKADEGDDLEVLTGEKKELASLRHDVVALEKKIDKRIDNLEDKIQKLLELVQKLSKDA
ncbi:hypothetical protein B0J11DRAFT_539417 [Dendryphion nanum]|uniref:Uncharacterized protein n=1 Tax=Dendryphion nanum TaxID=256645 RepID=A0A9P9IDV6_9PLEO|nr:hypothetical protein B0J11DRAFT_539417 [Dendryphion nanum]